MAKYKVNNQGKLLHRIAWEKTFGPIPHGWVVHHVDGNKKNNEISNLIAMPETIHSVLHVKMARTGTIWSRQKQLTHLEKPFKLLRILDRLPAK